MAGLYKLYKVRHDLSGVPGGSLALVVGALISFVVALLAMSWLLRCISRHDLKGFAIYRVVAGLAILTLSAVGFLNGA